MKRLLTGLSLGSAVAYPCVAISSDEAAEVWLNQSLTTIIAPGTKAEWVTVQRFRDPDDGRFDTYYARLWIRHDLTDALKISGGLERRLNEGGRNESQILQEVSHSTPLSSWGTLKKRLRFEQRFLDGTGRMGLRVRPELGVSLPLDAQARWSLDMEGELFATLRSNQAGGQDGLTGVRSEIGLSYAVTDALSLSLSYLRDQDIEKSGPDEIAHAPHFGLDYSF